MKKETYTCDGCGESIKAPYQPSTWIRPKPPRSMFMVKAVFFLDPIRNEEAHLCAKCAKKTVAELADYCERLA